MASLDKRSRAYTKLCKDAGCEVLAIERRGSGHYGFRLKHPDCGEFMIIVSYSPSDWRAEMNKKAELKKMIRERTEMAKAVDKNARTVQ